MKKNIQNIILFNFYRSFSIRSSQYAVDNDSVSARYQTTKVIYDYGPFGLPSTDLIMTSPVMYEDDVDNAFVTVASRSHSPSARNAITNKMPSIDQLTSRVLVIDRGRHDYEMPK